MTESIETSINTEENEIIESIRWELGALVLDIRKDSFRANQELKNKIKTLWFYNWNENWENIKFHIGNVKKYLESIKNKTWSDLDVKASWLEKWVRTIAIQIAINYINMKNWGATNNIDWIDGIRGNQTWKWVKEFQTTYGLKNKDGLPWHETITKILDILGSFWEDKQNDNLWENNQWSNQDINNHEINTWEVEESWERTGFLESRLNYSNIDDNKCINLLQNLKIYNGDWWYNLTNSHWDNLGKKLHNRFSDNSGLESVMLQNPEIWNLMGIIVMNQLEEIDKYKSRYLWKKEKNKVQDEVNLESNENDIEPTQSWEDYKFENLSLDNLEKFILSDEWLTIIIDEIKSHIDTSHEDNNGQYDRFYMWYPFSVNNLEIRLRNAWEDKMHWDYYERTYLLPENIEQMEKLDVLSHKITQYVDKIVWNYIKSGKEIFNQNMVTNLEWFMSQWIYGPSLIEMFSGRDSKDFKDAFQWLLSSRIKSYESFVRNENDDFILNTWDKQIHLQLKSYLYLYWRIFYPDVFKFGRDIKYYEDILPDVMKSILSNDDLSLIDKINRKELLITEQKLEAERKQRDLKRRQEIAKRNKERNERIQSSAKINKQINNIEIQTNPSNPNEATWPEIAAAANLNLNNYSLNIEESEFKEEWERETIFRNAYNKFIHSHGDIKAYITLEQMLRIFDSDNNSINERKWKEFKESNPIFKDKPDDEIENIRHIFDKFSWYYSKSKEELSKDSAVMNQKIDETVKIYAIWAVIDNVRDTFWVMIGEHDWDFKWFQLDKEKPLTAIKDINNNVNGIVISGYFNNSEVKIRYDLKTGELFMNSFLHRLSPNKINLWINSTIDYPIWTIKPFNNVLNDYYKLPPHSQKNNETHNWSQYWDRHRMDSYVHPRPNHDGGEPKNDSWWDKAHRPTSMWPSLFNVAWINTNPKQYEIENLLNSQMDLIGDAMEKHMKSQAQKSASINNFMKTFNIISDSWQFSSWDFNRWSNLYDIIEIIENTWDIKNGDIQSLEYFNDVFMPTIVKYSWLIWWEWHEYQEINEDYEKLTKYDGDNDGIKALQYHSNNYDPRPFSVANFDSSHQLWFAEFITGKNRQNNGKKDENKINFISRSEPDWILNKTKMEDFIRDLDALNREKKSDERNDSDKQPSEQLPNT